MAQQHINVGTVANDGTGDPLRTAFQKTEANFDELYAALPVSDPTLQEVLDQGSTASISTEQEVIVTGAGHSGFARLHPSQGHEWQYTDNGTSLESTMALNDNGFAVVNNLNDVRFEVNTTQVEILNGPLDMGSQKVKSLAAATANGEAVRYEQVTNGLEPANVTGTAISFAVPQIYGSDGSPETGNITVVTTGLIRGTTQLLIHNNGSAPTFGSPIKIISGAYVTGELNYIMLLAVSATSVLVTITQEV